MALSQASSSSSSSSASQNLKLVYSNGFSEASNSRMGGFPLGNTCSSSLALSGSQHSQDSAVVKATSSPEPKPKKKICCACPDTKRVRDECIVEHGEGACRSEMDRGPSQMPPSRGL